jgi:TRAP-type uncharacterized transport system substrate-binding protein
MKSFRFPSIFAILFFGIAATLAHSQDSRIVVAADSSSGTYSKMLGEIIGVCSTDQFNIEAANGVTGGAPGNLEALVQNRAQAAFLHSDVFFANAMSDPSYRRFQTLVTLYPEPIHVLALKESKTSKSGMTNFGKQEFRSLVDAKGYTVGAAGGGVYTAKILQGQGEGGFNVQPYNSGAEVLAALDKGDIAIAIFVGAAPLPNLETARNKANYKLIPIGEAIAAKVKAVYRPATVNYTGMTVGSVATLAPVATIMTRKYSTPEKIRAQANFRACFNKELGSLQDNASPNWQDVTVNDHGVLDWYELPTVEAVVAKAAAASAPASKHLKKLAVPAGDSSLAQSPKRMS